MAININLASSSTLPKAETKSSQFVEINKDVDIKNNKAEAEVAPKPASKNDAEVKEKLEPLVTHMSEMMSMMRKGLAFKVDNHSGQSVVSVMDINTGDVIRQIPSEEALKLAEKLTEVTGLLMKTEA